MRPDGQPTVRVAALQPRVRWMELGDTAEARDHAILDFLSEQTRRAGAQGAKLVVWPEAALHADPQIAYREPLSALAREIGAYLFVGYRFKTPSGNRNEVVTIGPDGAFLGKFGKDHPVSFMHETSVTRGDVSNVRDHVRRRRRRYLCGHRLHGHVAQARAPRRESDRRAVRGLARDLDEALPPRGLSRARDRRGRREVGALT